MASTADLVYENFVWLIGGLSPTSTLIKKARYHEIDRNNVDPAQAAGTTRAFAVSWVGSDEENIGSGGEGITSDGNSHTSIHRFEVEVYYSKKIKWRNLQRSILVDRWDLRKLLHSAASWVGYSDAQSSAEIGINNRALESTELDRDEDEYWIMRQTWRVQIYETEVV